MEHYQAKGVIFMIVAVLFCYSIGMVEQDTALLIIIVMLLGNILNVLCKILTSCDDENCRNRQ